MAGLLLGLAGCGAGGPFQPTATAIPLAATATPRPLPTQVAASPTAPPPTATAPASDTPDTSPTPRPRTLSELDDRLAQRTAEDFLARLAAGETETAFNLYLSDAAWNEAGPLQSRLAEANPGLASATLLDFRRASAASYEARALLRWAGMGDDVPSTQTLTLVLAYQRGLWLIDGITLGDTQASAPTPTPSRTGGTASRTAPLLAGRLVFQTSSGGDLYLIDADGSNLRRLTDGLDPAWSPDGQQIAFTRWRDPWGVYLVHPDGSSEERVVDGIRLKEAAWSPDGQKLAFTINLSSNEPIRICFFGFCFTLPPFSLGQMWMADLESGALLSLPLDDRAVHAPTWSADGGRIVYAGDRGLAWIDLDDMATGRFPGGSVWDTSPAFSPDGRSIAFMGRVHNRWEIFVMNADGSGRRQLTHADPSLDAPPSSVAPAWSPDGKHLAFLSNCDGPWRIYVMGADGSGQRPMFGSKLDSLGIRYEFATERVLSWSR